MRYQVQIQRVARSAGQYAGALVQLVADVGEWHGARHDTTDRAGDLVPGRRRHCRQAFRRQATQWNRSGGKLAPQSIRQLIAVIATQQLITGIAGQGHRHMLLGQLRDEEGRNLRRIGKRFVIQLRQPWNYGHGLLCRHIQFGMVGPQMPGYRFCMLSLVVAGLVKADGKSLDRPRRLRLHQCHHGGRIDTTGKKSAQWHIGHHLLADSILEQDFQRIDSLLRRTCERRSDARLGYPGTGPIRT